MNIYEVRKRNLKAIIGDTRAHGAVSAFARAYNLDPTYLRQILNDHRTMGEKAARKFEESLKLDRFQLDRPVAHQIEEAAAKYQTGELSEEALAVAAAFEASTPELRAAALRMLGVAQEIDKAERQ